MNFMTDRVFYIVCPAQVYTGGPLAQHQLAKNLIELGQDVFMYYYPNNLEDPVHPNFIDYKIPHDSKIIDSDKSVVIMPEVETKFVFDLKQAKKVIWWLSIDNYLFFTVKEPIVSFKKLLKNILFKLKVRLGLVTFFDIDNKQHVEKEVIHLAQSKYAFDFLNKLGLNPNYLHCHLLDHFYQQNTDFNPERENRVLYNPKKGKKFTDQIISKSNSEKQFCKIENLTPFGVKELLKTSKIYIDFGDHPGRDRFPREAAICGCVIITGKKGSALNVTDINIPDEYKFEDVESNVSEINELIKTIFDDYITHFNNQSEYRKAILKEKQIFDNEVRNLIDIASN